MALWKNLIDDLLDRLKKLTPQARREEKKLPSGRETGLRHADTGALVLLHDNGSLELSTPAGNFLTLQRANGQVSLRGRGISIEGDELHLRSGRLWLHGYQEFDPLGQWFSPPAPPPGDPTWVWRFSPLVARSADALVTLLSTPLVYGDPARADATYPGLPALNHVPGSGQRNITLGQLIRPQPLFGPNRELEFLLKHLAELSRELAKGAH